MDIQKLPFIPNRHRVELVLRSVGEWLRGLDFSMPDRMYDRNRKDGAMYTASPEKVLRQVFARVDREKYPALLDIGCGKGYVLWKAKEYGFQKVGGVEYDEKLVEICRRNMNRLCLDVEVTQADAGAFTGYGNYNVFYMANPFMPEVMERVIRRIMVQCRGKEILLIYYRPRYTESIERRDCFTRIGTLAGPREDYPIFIYRGRIPQEQEG